MELAPKCTAVEVAKWLDAGDTLQLASFLRGRHEARFFGPIECLRKAEDTYGGYGFSMMALCCLLTETIQCYREGMPTTSNYSELSRAYSSPLLLVGGVGETGWAGRTVPKNRVRCRFAHKDGTWRIFVPLARQAPPRIPRNPVSISPGMKSNLFAGLLGRLHQLTDGIKKRRDLFVVPFDSVL